MFQQSLGHRRRSQGDEGESRHHVRQAVSAVEAVFEFRQVALRIFRIERVVAGAQGRLQVAEHRVDPVELVFFHRGAAAAADHRLVGASGFGDAVEAPQPVGHRMGAVRQVLLRPLSDLRLAKSLDDAELDALRVALLGGLHRRHERRLALGAAAALAAASRAAQIRIVHLHQPRQALLPVALEHRLHQLVLHAPGRVVRNPQLAMQMHRRNALFALRQQVDRLEPHGQRQLRRLEDSAGDHRGLALAAVALAQLARVQVAALVVAAVRTHEAVRPAHLEQLVEALVLVAVFFHEFVQAEAFLELDRISSHG